MITDPLPTSNLLPNEGRTVKIGEASRILGLHIDTLRRWERSGKITPVRTPGGTRLYSMDKLSSLIPGTSNNLSRSQTIKQSPAKNLHQTNEGEIYAHIYNKGLRKGIIFNDDEDYKVFLGFLKDYLNPPQDPESFKKAFTVNGRVFRGTPHQPKNYFNQVELVAYSLMPDHFHLLLYQKIQGSLESFIRSLCTRYSIYFNKKYDHTGALFQGPYKSVRIEDRVRLLHLTRYLHHTGENSSYAEYLGSRVTSWVKPKVVLSFFEKGTGGYKDFMENQPNQIEKKFLEGITLESEDSHLERRNLAINTEKIHLGSSLKPFQRIPEFLAAVVIFLLLVAIGITNIQVSKVKGFQPLPTPAVLSETEINNPAPSQTPIPSTTKVSTAPDAVKPKILIIKIDGGGDSVNIRQKPTTDSEKIGEARDGDIFEFISKDSGWYEVKLPDGSTGFIWGTYIEMTEEEKN